MVGRIAQTGQVVACDFLDGNQSPNSNNLEFIIQCQKALPDGCTVQYLRIDVAGYQINIIKHCDSNEILYAIRAVMSRAIKETINTTSEDDWQLALMRVLLPEELAHHRVITIRWRLYAIAAKVVKTGRQLFVKVSRRHRKLLAEALSALRRFEPATI